MIQDENALVDIIACILYGSVMIVDTISLFFLCAKARHQYLKVIFHLFLFGVCLTRVVYYSETLKGNDSNLELVLNRVALLLFFTTFSLALFWWVESYDQKYGDSSAFRMSHLLGYLGINCTLYFVEMLIVVAYFIQYYQDQANWSSSIAYNLDIGFSIVYNFVLGMLFLVFGVVLFQKLRSSGDEKSFGTEKYWIIGYTTIMVLCYLCRVVVWLIRPVTGKYLPYPLWQLLGYWVPELVPCVVQFLVIHREIGREKMTTSLVEQWYQGNESDGLVTSVGDNSISFQRSSKDGTTVLIRVPLVSGSASDSLSSFESDYHSINKYPYM